MKGATIEYKTIAVPYGMNPVDFVTQAKEQKWNVSVLKIERQTGDIIEWKYHNVEFNDPATEVKKLVSEGWKIIDGTVERYWLQPLDEIKREREAREKEKGGIWLPSPSYSTRLG